MPRPNLRSYAMGYGADEKDGRGPFVQPNRRSMQPLQTEDMPELAGVGMSMVFWPAEKSKNKESPKPDSGYKAVATKCDEDSADCRRPR